MSRIVVRNLIVVALCTGMGGFGGPGGSATARGRSQRIAPASPPEEQALSARGPADGMSRAPSSHRATASALAADALAGDHAVLVGRWDPGMGLAAAVAVSGSTAYLSAGSHLRVLDVASPAGPAELSMLELHDDIWSISLAGFRSYVATLDSNQTRNLHIVDISTPAAPGELASYPLPQGARSISVAGHYAYISDIAAGLRIVDVSNPAAPVEVGLFPCLAQETAVSGSYAYVAAATGGGTGGALRIVDVSNPSMPAEVGSREIPDGANHVAVSGSYAYVTGSLVENAVHIVDISNPAAPTEVGSKQMLELISGVAAAGPFIYVITGDLHIVDGSNPTAPLEVGLVSNGFYGSIALSDSIAYLVRSSGLDIVDVSNPAAPTPIGRYDTAGNAYSVTLSNSLAYIAYGYAGLRIVDVSNPAAPAQVGALKTPGYSAMAALVGSHVYLAAGDAGLRSVDVSNPAAPVEVGSYSPTGNSAYAYGLAASGSLVFVFVSSDPPSVQVVDVSDPAAPVQASQYPCYGLDASFSESLTYLTCAGGEPRTGFRILDFTNPASPSEVGSFGTTDPPYRGAVSGSYAHLAYLSQVRIVDVSNPIAPGEMGSYDAPWFVSRVTLVGSDAYLVGYAEGGQAARESELRIVNVSNPFAPEQVGSCNVPDLTSDVSVAGPYIYVTGAYHGLYVLARDQDNDGVGDPTDACPASILTPTVEIGTCDSGVANVVSAKGCSISDQLAACAGGSVPPGSSGTACTMRALATLKHQGVLTVQQVNAINACTRNQRRL